MHRSQIFFYILLAFIAGIFAGSFFSISKLAVEAIALVCAVLIATFYRRGSRLLNLKIGLAAFLALFFILGAVRFNYVNSRQHNLQKFAEAQEQVVDPHDRRPIKVSIYGYVTGEPEISGGKQRFVFFVRRLSSNPYLVDLNEKILITSPLYPKYKYGDRLEIYGQVKKPENFSDFDYIAYLAKDNIYSIMFYPQIESANFKFSFMEGAKTLFFRKIFWIKSAFEQSIARSVSEPNAAFIGGILLGSRSQIPQDIKDNFAHTGTSHILAVSGYNITIVATIISWFFLLFFRRPAAFWFSLAAVALFTVLTGAQASVVRAAVMGAIVLLARREGRLNDPRNAIVLAGAIMILINPLILRHDVGFQLSFTATLGLIYVAPAIEKYFQKLPKFFELRETMIMTISAQIFVLPLLLFYFKNFSLTSLPANLIVLPTIPLAMALGFISGLAGLATPALGQLVGYFAWLLTSVELGIIGLLAKPGWATAPVNLGWPGVVAIYIFFVLLLVRLKKSLHERDF